MDDEKKSEGWTHEVYVNEYRILQRELHSAEERDEVQKQKIHELMMQVNALRKTEEDLRDEVVTVRSIHNTYEGKTKQLNAANDVLRRKLTEAQAKLEDEREAYEESLHMLENDAKMKDSLEANKTKDDKSEDGALSLHYEKIVNDLTNQVDVMAAKIAKCNIIENSLRSENNELLIGNNALKDDIMSIVNLLAASRKDVKISNEMLSEARDELAMASSELATLKCCPLTMRDRGNSLFGEVEDNRKAMQQRYEELKIKYREMQQQCARKTTAYNKAVAEKAVLTRLNAESKAVNEQHESELVAALETRIMQLETFVKKLQAEAKLPVKVIADLDTPQLEYIEKLMKKSRREVREMQDLLESRSATQVMAERTHYETQRQLVAVQAKLWRLESQIQHQNIGTTDSVDAMGTSKLQSNLVKVLPSDNKFLQTTPAINSIATTATSSGPGLPNKIQSASGSKFSTRQAADIKVNGNVECVLGLPESMQSVLNVTNQQAIRRPQNLARVEEANDSDSVHKPSRMQSSVDCNGQPTVEHHEMARLQDTKDISQNILGLDTKQAVHEFKKKPDDNKGEATVEHQDLARDVGAEENLQRQSVVAFKNMLDDNKSVEQQDHDQDEETDDAEETVQELSTMLSGVAFKNKLDDNKSVGQQDDDQDEETDDAEKAVPGLLTMQSVLDFNEKVDDYNKGQLSVGHDLAKVKETENNENLILISHRIDDYDKSSSTDDDDDEDDTIDIAEFVRTPSRLQSKTNLRFPSTIAKDSYRADQSVDQTHFEESDDNVMDHSGIQAIPAMPRDDKFLPIAHAKDVTDNNVKNEGNIYPALQDVQLNKPQKKKALRFDDELVIDTPKEKPKVPQKKTQKEKGYPQLVIPSKPR